MEQQCVKIFDDCLKIEDEINDYLKEHPNYLIDKIVCMKRLEGLWNIDRILVVFNVKELPTYSVACGKHSFIEEKLEDKTNEELKKIRSSMACGVEAADRIDKILKSRNYM